MCDPRLLCPCTILSCFRTKLHTFMQQASDLTLYLCLRGSRLLHAWCALRS